MTSQPPPPYTLDPKQKTSGTYNEDSDRLKIIVGLDYGTTNSGLCYVTSDQESPDSIVIVRQYPGSGTVSKVPSTIAYKNENTGEFGLQQDQWGFEARDYKAYHWTKLLLGGDSRSTVSSDTTFKKTYGQGFCTLPPGKTAKRVVRDYLQHLYKYFEDLLKRQDEAIFGVTPLEVWITVPAMWGDAARTATLEAAQAAGFASRRMDSIRIISEPEAAALSVLTRNTGVGALDIGDQPQNILICDCGGGTVDIVTYKVSRDNEKLNFEELLVGVGSLSGSTFIDRNFDAWMEKTFKQAYLDVDSELRGPASDFYINFENIKKAFTGPGHNRPITVRPIEMRNADGAKYNQRRATVRLETKDMLELFDPLIDEIIKLLDDQVVGTTAKSERIHQLFLVGGFGESPYLNTRIKDWCSSHQIQLKNPPSCQEAIVKGAALRGLIGLKPNKRLARRHYGHTIGRPFRPGLDNESNSYYCDFDKIKYCNNRIDWFLDRGRSMDDYGTESFALSRTFFEETTDRSCTITVYNSDRDVAPEHTSHWSLTKMGQIEVVFSEADIQRGSVKMINGRRMYKLFFDLEITLFSERGDLQLRALHNGIPVGQTKIEFDQNPGVARTVDNPFVN